MQVSKLNDIFNILKKYIDKFHCLVCKDVIEAQNNGENRACGVEDSTHKEGFLLTTLWLMKQDIPDWIDYDIQFASKDLLINNKLHTKGEIIRHPYAELPTSSDQIYPFLLGLLLYKHIQANPFYRRLRKRLFKCHNDNYIPPMYIATLMRCYKHENMLCRILGYILLPFKYLILNILDFLLIPYLMIVMGPIGDWIYWIYSKAIKLLGKEPGKEPFGYKTELNGKKIYMGAETLKIQPFLAIEIGLKKYPTIFIKIAEWLYYKRYGDVLGIFCRYFEGTVHKIDPLYSPPLHLLINYYLELKGIQE